MAGANYGVFLAFAILVFRILVPQPAGSVILYGLFSVQLSWGAIVWWRRTGLPFMTAALVHGAVMCVCLAVLAAIGRPFQEMSAEAWVLIVGASVTTPLLIHIESRVNKSKVKVCREHMMEHKNVWAILTLRHIPQLRDGGH